MADPNAARGGGGRRLGGGMFMAMLDPAGLDEQMVADLFAGRAIVDPRGAFIVTEGKVDFGSPDIDPRNPEVIANLRATAAMIDRLCRLLEEERTITLRRDSR